MTKDGVEGKDQMRMYRESLRIIRLFWGLFLYAAGIVLTVRANIGLSPWDVLHQGLSLHTGLSFGDVNILVASVIVITVILMRERVGLGTVCNMFFIGVFINILMKYNLVPGMTTFVSGVAMLVSGLFVIAFASVFYIGAGYGAGPRDSLMVILARRTGRPVGLCRIGVEGTVLTLGWLLGGGAGLGTVISAFGIGFAVQIVFTLLRFNVRAIHHESFFETFARLKR